MVIRSLQCQLIGGKEKKYLLNCIKTNYVSTVGNYVGKFEKKIGGFIKSRYSLSCNSGTSALHLALRVVGVKSNHEVIVPTISFIATANAVRYLKASPVFMDCDDYFNIDIKKTDEKLIVCISISGTYLRDMKKRLIAEIPTKPLKK